MEIKEVKKHASILSGEGYGDCHMWYEYNFTENDNPVVRYATWKCRKCFVVFNHMYNYIPNVFTAMEACKVPNVCSRVRRNEDRADITGVGISDRDKLKPWWKKD